MNPTKSEINGGLQILISTAQLIRTLKTIPAGELYAQLMSKMDLAGFESMIALLVKQGLVKRHQSHLLEWTGS
jgi:hypothetical protein